MGVRFTAENKQSDATTYLLPEGKDSYFDASVTIYNDRFRFDGPLNGAHHRLPQGEVIATGDFADSRVTGIRSTASL